MAHVSYRLRGALAGALAAGGDPATSPLYVFGPFLAFLAVAGGGAASFGASIWLVVVSVCVVALMYRNVMAWVTDGSGGSGLCEEELGGWAVKINAAITVVEYTLTFLVSIAALVTLIADRAPLFAGRGARVALATVGTLITAAVVNRGPKIAARVFGPATAAVLLLLWTLVIATVTRRGFALPQLRFEAFHGASLGITLNGYVRLLALMTGIEVFANLVAAYDGTARERARQAFGSMLIVMGTTLTMMLVVGPAIFALSDPAREDVSVFTQTMDALLPRPLPYAGTVIGIVVLLSAAAASAQGLQNLALGLRHRHYVPARLGQRNAHDVADRPVWIQAGVVCLCFALLGTREHTYLGLYAAGVFVLLSLTAIASVKRLLRTFRARAAVRPALSLAATTLAALVTTGSAVLIFIDRMREGAWAYGILIPLLYVAFGRTRKRLGNPTNIEDRLGRVLGEHRVSLAPEPPGWPTRILIVVDGSLEAEAAVLCGVGLSARFHAPAHLCVVGSADEDALRGYGEALASLLVEIPSVDAPSKVERADDAARAVARVGADLVVAVADVADFRGLPRVLGVPVLFLRASAAARIRHTLFQRIVVGLDGSSAAEATLPLVRACQRRGARVTVAAIPDGSVEASMLPRYAERIAASLGKGEVDVEVTGSGPARTLLRLADERDADLIVVGSRGYGGTDRGDRVPLGSVPARLIEGSTRPVLVVPSDGRTSFDRVLPGVLRASA